MKLWVKTIIFMSIILLMGCQQSVVTDVKNEDVVKQLTIEELKEQLEMNASDVVFIDVREHSEYVVGHIEEFALFPLSTLEQDYHQLPKEKEIVIICRSGNRSMQAASFLQANGFTQLTNVTKGMNAWDGPIITIE